MIMSEQREVRQANMLLIAVVAIEVVVITVLAYTIEQLREGIATSHERSEQALEMVLGTYSLRQSSDYLTRFARSYVVTGDPAWRELYRQVLDIRRGDALRPKDYESIYWDLIEPYRSNAHPLLYPISLRSILEGLPFTAAELDLLQEAEDNSEKLARIEQRAFEAVEDGRHPEAIDALFSVDYLRAKHTIMQPIDELMVRVRERIEANRDESLARAEALMGVLLWGAGILLLGGLLPLLVARWRARRAMQDFRGAPTGLDIP